MRHVGILAHSVPGAAMCFERFGEYAMRSLGAYQHPDVTLDCIPMGRSMPAWELEDFDTVRGILATSVERLAVAGADFFVCPDNTAHLALERPGPDLALPGIHIAEIVAKEAVADGFEKVGILGTRWTMDAPMYPQAFARRGLDSAVPAPADRAAIQQLTFDELVHGVFTDSARDRFVQVIESLRDAGCDAVALVCTEFPLLIPADVSPLPTLESTVLCAHAAADLASGDDPLPDWRGGPLAGTG